MFLHNEDTPKRSSVWCRVICSRPSLKISTRLSTNHPSWTGKVLVTDASLHLPPQGSQEKDPAESSRYVSLEVRPSNVLTESVIKTLGEAGSVLYIEDVACTGKGIDLGDRKDSKVHGTNAFAIKSQPNRNLGTHLFIKSYALEDADSKRHGHGNETTLPIQRHYAWKIGQSKFKKNFIVAQYKDALFVQSNPRITARSRSRQGQGTHKPIILRERKFNQSTF